MQCDQCGSTLPRDDARFCASCGALVGANEQQPSQSPDDNEATLSSDYPKRYVKKTLREQVARQPSALSTARAAQEKSIADNPAASDEKPGNTTLPETAQAELPQPEQQSAQSEAQLPQTGGAVSPPAAVKPRQAAVTRDFELRKPSAAHRPVPVNHAPLSDNVTQVKDAAHAAPLDQPAAPEAEALPANALKKLPTRVPKRELHVKVWKQPAVTPAPVDEMASPSHTPSPEVTGADDVGDVEHLPTRPLGPTETPQPHAQAEAIPATPASDPPLDAASQSLDQIDTMQLTASPRPQRNPVTPLPQRGPIISLPRHLRSVARPSGPLMLLAILLPILIIGGLGLWIALAQPFSVAPVTQPWQSYSDPSLGMSFIYPNDWSRQIDRNKSMVQLNDSSHTAQVAVAVSSVSSTPLNQFAQQQAKQFGLTTTKPAPTLTFAGATWQQLQGNTQISGANYSGRILSTTHGNRHYVIVQLAPLATYSDEEKVIFSPMQASWKFRP